MSAPKGPYTVKPWGKSDDWKLIYDADDKPVALCVNEAVAKEMAAAPEMRAALVEAMEDTAGVKGFLAKGRAALAKAGKP